MGGQEKIRTTTAAQVIVENPTEHSVRRTGVSGRSFRILEFYHRDPLGAVSRRNRGSLWLGLCKHYKRVIYPELW